MEGSSDKVHPRSARLAGADVLPRQAASENADGFGMIGMTSAGMRMTARLSMGQIQSDSREVSTHAGDQAGAEAVLVAAIPGLLQVV
jgi:hypothetical protein